LLTDYSYVHNANTVWEKLTATEIAGERSSTTTREVLQDFSCRLHAGADRRCL
jgi:hypothetical protein